MIDKNKLLDNVIAQLNSDLKSATEAVNMAYESATHEENVSECKYDTKGLEASYLVQGQARRVEELEESIEAIVAVKVLPVFKIMLSALICLENEMGQHEWLFILPASGGLKINFDDKEITLVTPISPLGRELIGKTLGTSISVLLGNKKKEYRILEVY
ncbi:MAG: GreA/GreB family elongation factor [Lentisphaeraceae bacterium]|nr:GreA/GreB family elongation factor [Lentisphaeraceae bacterium]